MNDKDQKSGARWQPYGISWNDCDEIFRKIKRKSKNPSRPEQRIHSIRYPNDQVKKQQGRNELCACGSGIKYKKCCLIDSKIKGEIK